MKREEQAILVLEDGTAFIGKAFGARGQTYGEVVFSTGMTGYQETFTDPSYHKQIIVMTAPHIGNTGVNSEDSESSRYWAAGIVVRDPARRASNWRSERDLESSLIEQGIVGISDIDTRALTRHLREQGVLRGGIFSGDSLPFDVSNADDAPVVLLESVLSSPQMAGAHLCGEVSTQETYVIEPAGKWKDNPQAHIVAVDLGIKSRTPYYFARNGAKVTVVPSSVTFEEIENLSPDGVFFSNGPGDPETADKEVELLRQVLDAKYPFFGICFGNQLLGRALGFDTYKLTYGHRGINQPVMDKTTGKVEVTAHNHGFALNVPLEGEVTAPFNDGVYGRVKVSHICLNDDVVEGIECLDIPAFSVQYHPEAAAGPHDASYLFERYMKLISDTRNTQIEEKN
ncbi:MAG: glutamine-hydrolyzing carbamoyl-phosphate synthase small subunit [Actinomycetaceae bacterium]|nr:glutamine-hydrolyzing carbamoyl-phosphate synthase small subunit [Actinomycetaceae bacterium]